MPKPPGAALRVISAKAIETIVPTATTMLMMMAVSPALIAGALVAGIVDQRLTTLPPGQMLWRGAAVAALGWLWLRREQTSDGLVAAATAGAWILGQRLVAVGLTGGIACGKSTVARCLESRGALVVDADKVAHDLQKPGSATFARLVSEFGEGILKPDGEIDRRALGARVFDRPEALRRLNAITHPAIGWEIARLWLWHSLLLGRTVVIDAALLTSSWLLRTLCHPIIVVVITSSEVQVARLQSRDGLPDAEARARIASQPTPAQLIARAGPAWRCIVIENDGSVEQLRRAAEAVAAAIL